MPHKLYVGTNTKMHKGIAQTVSYLRRLGELCSGLPRDDMELFVLPSFTALYPAADVAKEFCIRLGAQNVFWMDEGDYTGEVSPPMVKEVGADIAAIGHSERRRMMMETDEEENCKVLRAMAHGITPLLCVGETRRQQQEGRADEVLAAQLRLGLNGADPRAACGVWVAYEPMWAIGEAGTPACADYVRERHRAIRGVLRGMFGAEYGGRVPILYGGSVNNGNATAYAALGDVDGLFIGRSAWDADNFSSIIRSVLPVYRQKEEAQ